MRRKSGDIGTSTEPLILHEGASIAALILAVLQYIDATCVSLDTNIVVVYHKIAKDPEATGESNV